MTWRGSTDTKDRIFSVLVYLIAVMYALPFGRYLFVQFPELQKDLNFILSPLLSIYKNVPFAGMIIFFVLFLAVVRNPRVSHFLRFNTMQTILLTIGLFLLELLLGILARPLSGLIVQTLSNTVFLGVLGICVYSMVQSALGRYAEIPSLSDAVYNQVR
ncbi:MAG: Tic20 family protein [Jaaginema sp. PMC 1079.18]|nr:Tic20 family protein [Jaaginema sp. PMC 1080.18]MEC4849510.1 Tic20 family protein [Jaaginema sp. PMC 1079.18]